MTELEELPAVLQKLQTSKEVSSLYLDDNSQLVYATIIHFDGKFSVSFYDAESSNIIVVLDTVGSHPFSVVENLFNEIKPDILITCNKINSQMFDFCNEYCKKLNETSSNTTTTMKTLLTSSKSNMVSTSKVALNVTDSNSISSTEIHGIHTTLELLPSSDFSFEQCKRNVLNVTLPGMSKDMTDIEKKFYMTSILPFDCTCAVRSLGGLLRFLEKKRIGIGLEGKEAQTPIASIETVTFENVLFVDKLTLESLQVFHQVAHPSTVKSSYKEGLSLFGILNRAVTIAGKKLMRSWFYRPTSDENVLKRRHDAINFFIDSKNYEITGVFNDNLKQICNVSRIISRLKSARLTVSNWKSLFKTSLSALRIADVCRSLISESESEHNLPEIFVDVCKYFTSELNNIVHMIDNTIDFEQSSIDGCIQIQTGVSKDLDKLRQKYLKIPGVLHTMAEVELNYFSDYITECQVVYLRRIGYLLFIVKANNLNVKKSSDGVYELPNAFFIAESPETIYFKTPLTTKLDEEYGDVLEDISDLQVEILCDIQNTLSQYCIVLQSVSKLTSELDCLLSFAVTAKEFDYNQPKVSERREIKIVEGRHPLQEHTVSLFVANSTNLNETDGTVQIITGPNACGKSVYLKQVGLIAYMTFIGSYVPAKSAKIGKINRIFSKIKSVDSISTGLSSFASDLAQMSQAVNKATENSLVLIDEFGKGTSAIDGQSLFLSVISYWLDSPNSPYIIANTHYTKACKLLNSPFLKFLTMETITNELDELIFLYKLVEGVSGRVNSSEIAIETGIPEHIVKRGQQVSKLLIENAPLENFIYKSSSSYPDKCDKVVEKALECDMNDFKQIEKLLEFVKNILGDTLKN